MGRVRGFERWKKKRGGGWAESASEREALRNVNLGGQGTKPDQLSNPMQ